MDYQKFMTEQQRLVMLRILSEVTARTANSSVIYNLMARWGLPISRDKVKTMLRWLEEQELVTIQPVESVLVATLTNRGMEVVKGFVIIDGIAEVGG